MKFIFKDIETTKSGIISIFKSKTNFYIALLLAMLFTNFPFGFRYFTFSDDYNSYGIFSLYRTNIWQDIMVRFTFYGMRPLAGLTDAYIIAWFWGNMHFVLITIVLMRFFAILLLGNILERGGIVWGRAAAVFFAFFPGITESVYWISASSRIVTSAFLAILAAYAILKFIYREGRWKHWLILAIVCGLLAQGYYEQGIIFAFVIILGTLVIHRKAIRNKLIYLWPFINLAIIGTYYYIMRDVGHLGHRTEFTDQNVFYQIYIVTMRVGNVFLNDQLRTAGHTMSWGISSMLSEHLLIATMTLLLAAVLAFFIVFDKKTDASELKAKLSLSIAAGIMLFICTFGIFFLLDQAWVWARNTFFSLIGLAIFTEIIIQALRFDWHKIVGPVIKGIAAFGVVAILLFSFILEVQGLKRVERNDSLIVRNLVERVNEIGIMPDETVWFLGLRWNYEPKINPRITSQVRIDWALLGHYHVVYGSDIHPYLFPVMSGDEVNISENDFILGLDGDLNVRKLLLQDEYLFFSDTGEVFGRISSGRFYNK